MGRKAFANILVSQNTTANVPTYFNLDGEVLVDDQADSVERLRDIIHDTELQILDVLGDKRNWVDFCRSEQAGHLLTDINALTQQLYRIGRAAHVRQEQGAVA